MNQFWKLNDMGDTIVGNYYKKISSSSLDLKKQRVYFYLERPFFSNESEVFLCLPQDPSILRSDFSNENLIKWDTIKSLSTRFSNQNKYQNRNHHIIFDLNYSSKGKILLKGILIECKIGTSKKSDSVCRKIYINEFLTIE